MAYWIAYELVKAGLARFHEDSVLNAVTLNKIHWRETKLQTGRQISSLPSFFYPQTRKYIKQLKERAVTDSAVASEYGNALRLTRDIVDCRLKKIASLGASAVQTEEILRGLSKEERLLYETIHSTILSWRSRILKVGE